MADLRAHLQAVIAGTLPPPRGNVLLPAAKEAARPFARACITLHNNSRDDEGERLTAPIELLTLLP
jgi:hypothetical protein